MLIAGAVRKGVAAVRLEIVNPTEQNFEGVEVLVDLPPGVQAWLDTNEPFDYLGAPEPVQRWGSRDLLSIPTSLSAPVARGFRPPAPADEIERSGERWRVRFHPRHVRPGERVALSPVHLSLTQDQAGQHVELRWRLTSTGADGWREGSIIYAVAEKPVVATVRDES